MDPNPSQPGLPDLEDATFWTALNPELSITHNPISGNQEDFRIGDFERNRCLEQIVGEGYLKAESIIPPDETVRIARAIQKIVDRGLPPAFIFVYDEVWQIFGRLGGVIEPILGHDFKNKTSGMWAWHIDRHSTGFTPHRDLLDSNNQADGRPTNLTIWIPFTDASPVNGCMYVLPTNRDPNYPHNIGRLEIRNLQDIRALPAPVGSILGWNAGIIHWGGRCSQWMEQPRMSISMTFVCAGTGAPAGKPGGSHKYGASGSSYHYGPEMRIDESARLTFNDRLNYIGEAAWFFKSRVAQFLPDAAALMFEFCKRHSINPQQASEVDDKVPGLILQIKKQTAKELFERQNYTGARKMLQEVCSLSQGDTEAWQALGLTCAALNAYGEAEQCFSRVLAVDPRNQFSMLSLGKVYIALKRYPEAIAVFQGAICIKGDDAQTHHALAMSYAGNDNLDEAVNSYRKAISLNPGMIITYNDLCALLLRMDRRDEAARVATDALERQPDNQAIRALLSSIET